MTPFSQLKTSSETWIKTSWLRRLLWLTPAFLESSPHFSAAQNFQLVLTAYAMMIVGETKCFLSGFLCEWKNPGFGMRLPVCFISLMLHFFIRKKKSRVKQDLFFRVVVLITRKSGCQSPQGTGEHSVNWPIYFSFSYGYMLDMTGLPKWHCWISEIRDQMFCHWLSVWYCGSFLIVQL